MNLIRSAVQSLPYRLTGFLVAASATLFASKPALAAQGLGNIVQNSVNQNASGLRYGIDFLAVLIGLFLFYKGVVGLISVSKGRSQSGPAVPIVEILVALILMSATFWITTLLFTTTGGSVSNVSGLQ